MLGEWSVSSNFLSKVVSDNNRYTPLLENISLYYELQHMFELQKPSHALSLSLSPSLSHESQHPRPYCIALILNVTILHYKAFAKTVHSHTNSGS
jgi:hypothetical protein